MFALQKLAKFTAVTATLLFTTYLQAAEPVKLATTTSTENSGLLDYILPTFEEKTGYDVQVIATGTGQALKLGRQGDVDVVMTHAPGAEAKFVEEGFGRLPRGIMENDFVIIGPKNDPAQIRNSASVEEAFGKLRTAQSPFVSRGDNSGTHMKEMAIWKDLDIDVKKFRGYREVGQGMERTMFMADELDGYALADRGTYTAFKDKLDMAITFDGGNTLANPYQIILISEEKYPDLNHKGAQAFSDWLISDEAQAMINSYKVNGEQLFKATYNK